MKQYFLVTLLVEHETHDQETLAKLIHGRMAQDDIEPSIFQVSLVSKETFDQVTAEMMKHDPSAPPNQRSDA